MLQEKKNLSTRVNTVPIFRGLKKGKTEGAMESHLRRSNRHVAKAQFWHETVLDVESKFKFLKITLTKTCIPPKLHYAWAKSEDNSNDGY